MKCFPPRVGICLASNGVVWLSFVGQEANKLHWRNLHKWSSRWGDKSWIPTPNTWGASNKDIPILNIKYCISNIYMFVFPFPNHFCSPVLPFSSSVGPFRALPPSKSACKGQRLLVQSWQLTNDFQIWADPTYWWYQCGFNQGHTVAKEHFLQKTCSWNTTWKYLEYFCNSYWRIWQEINWLTGSFPHKVTSGWISPQWFAKQQNKLDTIPETNIASVKIGSKNDCQSIDFPKRKFIFQNLTFNEGNI